jgi:hypothetical protein
VVSPNPSFIVELQVCADETVGNANPTKAVRRESVIKRCRIKISPMDYNPSEPSALFASSTLANLLPKTIPLTLCFGKEHQSHSSIDNFYVTLRFLCRVIALISEVLGDLQ